VLHGPFVLLILLTAGVGYGMLYSAAGGDHHPWAWRHGLRFLLGLGPCLIVALIDPRTWFRFAYGLYALALAGLVAVELAGNTAMGAQRWIDLGLFRVQPSEVMKVALVLALARYFHNGHRRTSPASGIWPRPWP
jgi:rod shape determining protein RodA